MDRRRPAVRSRTAFACTGCGKIGADVWPCFDYAEQPPLLRAIRRDHADALASYVLRIVAAPRLGRGTKGTFDEIGFAS